MIDSDGTYHAPAHISVNQQLGGCQLLGNDHVLNTRVDGLPVHARSGAWMGTIPSVRVSYLPSWGENVITSSTPITVNAEVFAYTPANNGWFELPQWPYLHRENGVFSSPLDGEDRHTVTIDQNTCQVYEIYNEYPAGTMASAPAQTAQSGYQYNSMTYALPGAQGATDAASLPLAPLTLRLSEIKAGAVKHALRFTLTNNLIGAHQYVWPASQGSSGYGAATAIPYGTRFRLQASFDSSHFSVTAQILLAQLKNYGLILADGGQDWQIETDTDVTEDRDVMAALNEVGQALTTANFEIVDESSLEVSATSGQVNPANGYVTPANYAVVIATDSSNRTAQLPIALTGVRVAVPAPALWIQSGVSKQLSATVEGRNESSGHLDHDACARHLERLGPLYSAHRPHRPGHHHHQSHQRCRFHRPQLHRHHRPAPRPDSHRRRRRHRRTRRSQRPSPRLRPRYQRKYVVAQSSRPTRRLLPSRRRPIRISVPTPAEYQSVLHQQIQSG